MSVESETTRLKALTTRGEPKTPEKIEAVLELVKAIRDHADERCAFYAEGDVPVLAELWSELAVQADYRAEKIAAGEWPWVA
jgi:hypothetical protein